METVAEGIEARPRANATTRAAAFTMMATTSFTLWRAVLRGIATDRLPVMDDDSDDEANLRDATDDRPAPRRPVADVPPPLAAAPALAAEALRAGRFSSAATADVVGELAVCGRSIACLRNIMTY